MLNFFLQLFGARWEMAGPPGAGKKMEGVDNLELGEKQKEEMLRHLTSIANDTQDMMMKGGLAREVSQHRQPTGAAGKENSFPLEICKLNLPMIFSLVNIISRCSGCSDPRSRAASCSTSSRDDQLLCSPSHDTLATIRVRCCQPGELSIENPHNATA